ncbi:hypothetical protein BGX27_010600 [Mortierella sp. AM989]|nr:hypothetical protein BGX27_010600 [Mortierella sp. AM989]
MVSIHDASAPKSQPIESFKDLLAWQPGLDEFNVSHIPFHPRPAPLRRKRGDSSLQKDIVKDGSPALHQPNLNDCKVIVCHDMAGGYTDDASPQGNDYRTIYSAQYWNHVDTFIYFSHHRITIPPPVWTNAAHKNGVRCLGTIITEWLPGILETDEMVSGPDQALADEDGIDTVDRRWFSRTYADKLVDLAVYYKFDGWFINIESILRGGAKQANQTIAFLAYLREQIHARVPGGELIWYDSVISSTGELAWQDKLSPENYRFFEQTDGIFINYTWKEYAVGESVALAGPRNRDVYTGIDVWGRNTFGGGGYTTYKALEVIQREGTSCALFAPAWTYESLGKEDFMTNDRLFWTGYSGAGIHAESLPLSSFYDATCRLLSGELGKKPDDGKKDVEDISQSDNKAFLPVSAYIPARPSGTSSWFYSNFDRGFGKGFWINGKKVSDKPWSHLSHQSLPPSMTKEIFILHRDFSAHLPVSRSKVIHWILSPEEAYHGGTSIVIQEFTPVDPMPSLPPIPIPPLPTDPPGPENEISLVESASTLKSKAILVPLFDTHISLLNAQNSTVELIFKPCQDDVQVGVHLGMLATENGRGSDLSRITREVSKQEFWKVLRPEVRKQGLTLGSGAEDSVSNAASSMVAEGGLVGLLTLDNATTPYRLEPVFAISHSLKGGNGLYSIEPLLDGWRRLTLHLSSLFDPQTRSSGAGEENIDLSSIALSQIGITVNYEGQASDPAFIKSCQEDSRPLLIVGSLAVVPTWSAQFQGSCVLGLKAQENVLVLIDQCERQEQEFDKITKSDKGKTAPWAKLSSSLTWNIGFPTTGEGITYPAKSNSIHTYEYSHYYVYLSVEKTKATIASAANTIEDVRAAAPVFVGMAFTTRYQISNLEIPLDNALIAESFAPGKLVQLETLKQNGLEIWAWVQGIRRDGRADARHDWSKAQLL